MTRAPADGPKAGATRPVYVSVIGASRCGAELAAAAEELGRLFARHGCVVVCGGRSGVMEAVARGVALEGGVSIGLLPDADRTRAAPGLTYAIPTAIGWARNLAVVASGDVVVAVGGAWGTLSEIALARNLGRRVVLLDSWELRPPRDSGADAAETDRHDDLAGAAAVGGGGDSPAGAGDGALDGIERATTPADAVERALRHLRPA